MLSKFLLCELKLISYSIKTMKVFFLYFINTKIQDKIIKSKCVLVHAFKKRCRDDIRHEIDLMREGQRQVWEPSDHDDDLTTTEGGRGLRRLLLKEPITAARIGRNHEATSPDWGVPHLTTMGLPYSYSALFRYWLRATWKESMTLVWPW